MAYTPNSVVTQTFSFEDFIFTMLVSGAVTVNDVGKAVALDLTAPNTVKLAGDGDAVFGRLETFEDRTQEGIKVGAVSRKFRTILPTSAQLAVGDEVVGSATAGAVKANPTQPEPGAGANVVVEVISATQAVVEKL